jgi:hypothetical protein
MNRHFMKHKRLTSDRLLRLNSPQIPPWPNSLTGGRTEAYCKIRTGRRLPHPSFKVQMQVMLLFSIKREELGRFWHFTRHRWTSLGVWCDSDECLYLWPCVSGKAILYSSSNALHNLGVETTWTKCMSSKDFIKRPRVSETAVPYLVDRLQSLLIVLALRPGTH